MRQGVSVTIMFDVEGVSTLEEALDLLNRRPTYQSLDEVLGVTGVRYEGHPYTIRELNESCGPV